LWSEIKKDDSFGDGYVTFPKIFTQDLISSYENEWDVMPDGRHKTIHNIGAVCPFTVDVSAGKLDFYCP
jgi:hypothetical protein